MKHKALDKTIANAYGWHDYTQDMPDADIATPVEIKQGTLYMTG